MRSLGFLIFLIGFMLILDFSIYPKFNHLLSRIFKIQISRIFIFIYWTIPILMSILALIMLTIGRASHTQHSNVYILSGLFILIYIPKLFVLVFTLIDYFINLIGLLITKFSSSPNTQFIGKKISRSMFLSNLGFLTGAILFGNLLWGILVGKTNYALNRIRLKIKNLPGEFNGFKIIQISDIHLGSWSITDKNKEFFKEVVAKINNEKPDLIVFTGDLVNNYAIEADPVWIDILKNLKAKHGQFSTLGNHDYGLYGDWKSDEEKLANMAQLYDVHKKMNFRLLNNETASISLNNQKLHIVGVENWGSPPFPQFGDYSKATKNIPKDETKILLSHDPSHWEKKIKDKNENIALTLSGHTHGMQFALNFKGKKWSPVQWRYKYWQGLYQENEKYLYVNIGLGHIAYPGRVGTPPEISIFELQKKA